MSDGPTAEQLLADADWLKRLAIRLAGNADDADDLVQESWIAAWRRRPDQSRSLRPWFTKVVRDLALMRRRADGRRTVRDQAWEDSREDASPEELLEQVRLHRLLADLVLELDEPYRSTIIARFVDDRSASDLARTLGIPESTVRGRLRDGLARLRSKLDERRGCRKAWAPLVLAFARGGLNVAKRSKAIAVLVALLLLVIGGATTTLLLVRARAAESRAARSMERASSAAEPTAAAGDRLGALTADRRLPAWMAQPGAPARRIAGRVLVDGAPAAGALVRVTSELSHTGLLPALELRTAADGRFDFGPQLAREVTVSASMPGKLAAIQTIDLRDPVGRPDALELAITSCVVSLYGKVLDAAGGPIAGARLLREDAAGVESDATGAYEVCLLPTAATPEQTVLVVRADGYGAIATAVAPYGRVRHDFVLTPEATISGTAVTVDGAPVANAKVWAEPDYAASKPEDQPARAMTVTDERGRFQLSGLAGGRHRVGGLGDGLSAPPIVVSVGAGEAREVMLQMVGIGVVRGHVVRDGAPVAGARVAAAGDGLDSAVSQADGSFVLDRVPVGDIHFTAAPFRVTAPLSITVAPGDNSEVTLQVEALGRLHGTVRHGGTPVPNARVSVLGPSNLSASADARGRFTLDGLEPGAYSLVADDSRLDAYVDGVHFELALGQDRELDVELASAGHIAGVVVDGRGAPVAGAHVEFVSTAFDAARCVTSETGAFECGQLAGGRYTAAVFPSAVGSAPYRFLDPTPGPIDLEDRVEGVRLVVDPERRSIRGIVVNPAGEPVADARVHVASKAGERDSSYPWMSAPAGVTDVDGAFHIDDLAPGTYALVVRTRDGARSERPDVLAGTSDVRLVVEPTCGDEASVVREEPRDIQRRPQARIVWDGRVELVGWSIPAAVRLDQDFEMTLYYRVLRPIDRSWKTFVHLDGTHLRLNADHEPVGGRCPMASWQPGDYIVDRFTARFGAGDYEPGTYTIWTGFFIGWAGRWMNMAVTDAPADARGKGDRVKVTVLAVQQ